MAEIANSCHSAKLDKMTYFDQVEIVNTIS